MTISIQFRALTPKKYKFAPEALISDVHRFMGDFLSDILDEARRYPPVPVDSKYERTYLLYDSWVVGNASRSGTALSRNLLNTAPYAAFVQGDFQTHVHQMHGWIRVRDIAVRRRGGYRGGIQAIVRAHIGR